MKNKKIYTKDKRLVYPKKVYPGNFLKGKRKNETDLTKVLRDGKSSAYKE